MLKTIRKTLSQLLVLSLVLFALPVFAQTLDAGTALPSGLLDSPEWQTFASDPTNVEAGAKLLVAAVMVRNWGLLASALISALIALLRAKVPSTTKVGAWLQSKAGAIVTNLTLSLGLGLATAFASGTPFGVDFVVKALTVFVGSAGVWAVWKNLMEAKSEGTAQKAGAAAAEQPKNTLDK